MIVHTAVRKKVPLKKKVRSKKHNAATSALPSKEQTKVPIQSVVSSVGATATTTVLAPLAPIAAKRQKASKKKSHEKVPDAKAKKKAKHKQQEIIDYSSRSELHSNTFGKVQKWLMDNPLVTTTSNQSSAVAATAINHTAHVTNISKSVSTPEKLTLRSPSKPAIAKPKIKTKSVGNLNEKVRLQVVYKPPFKFSLKLSKNENNVKTQIVGGTRSKRNKPRDKKRVGVEPPRRRSAILMRDDEKLAATREPTYETLTPKKELLTAYENMAVQSTPINSATFRISKSASSGNATGAHHHSASSISKVNSNPNGRRASLTPLTPLTKHYGGSSQNLMRSSTTNLTKAAQRNSFHHHQDLAPLSRSSTTNLTRERNLRRGSTDDLAYSRKNSVSSGRHVPPRTPSTSNLSKKHSSSGNIHRLRPVERQISLGGRRPHTADDVQQKHFIWPPPQPNHEPLPSDLEVMVSDVENIVQDR